MDKAYDLKALVASMKEDGLEIAEEGAKAAIEKVFAWVEASAKLSPNKFDDAIVGFMPSVKAYILEMADLINKADNVKA